MKRREKREGWRGLRAAATLLLIGTGVAGAQPASPPASRLFASDAPLQLRLAGDLRALVNDRDSLELTDHPFTLSYAVGDAAPVSLDVEIRTRGHWRRQERHCDFPPLRLDVPRGKARETLFAGQDKLKLVTPCKPGMRDYVEYILREYLVYRYVPGPATLFTGVHKLPPGTIGVWEEGRLVARRYYEPPDGHARAPGRAGGEPVSEFLARLDEAVRVRLVSDVPFGAFLSGGVDSSAVVALMARHVSGPVKTFSAGFEDQRYSELAFARLVADTFRTDHQELVVGPDRVLDELPGLVRFRDAPVSEPADAVVHLLAREARRSVTVVLTGEGGDEVLGGYPKHVYERYVRAYHVVPAALRSRLIEPLVQRLPYRFRRAKTAVATLGLTDPADRYPRWFGALARDEWARFVAPSFPGPREASPSAFDVGPGNTPLRRLLAFDQASWLPDNLLERGDRMTMAASLEARVPFLDTGLVRFVSSLPDRYRVRGHQTKWILRQAMAGLLPGAILRRRKVGFRVPVNEWFRRRREDLHDCLVGSHSVTRAYYRPDALQAVLDEHLRGRQNHEKLLWTLLNLELWHRAYAAGAPRPAACPVPERRAG